MKTTHIFSFTLVLIVGAFALSQSQSVKDHNNWYPFNIAWNDTTPGELDLRYLNDSYAGCRGFLKATDDGHVAFENSLMKKERFWGAQFSFASQMPQYDQSRKTAKHFAKIGFNLWKTGALQFLWNTALFSSIADKSERMDRFDYFFSEMKKNGVYCLLQLDDYGMPKIIADGNLKGSVSIKELGKSVKSGYQYLLDDEIWSKEQQYLNELLNHRNPYTGLCYKDDPAIVLMEMLNENDIICLWLVGRITENNLTTHYWNILEEKWNSWLLNKYSLSNGKNRDQKKIERKIPSYFAAAGKQKIELLSPPPVKGIDREKLTDYISFLSDIQKNYFDSVKVFLRSLGVKSLFTATQSLYNNASLVSTLEGDVMDAHIYFDHPDIEGTTGRILNSDPFEKNKKLSQAEVGTYFYFNAVKNSINNKPFFVSEVNWSYPNSSQYMFLPFLSSYASFQNWDGVILHNYAAFLNWDSSAYIESQLTIRCNPMLMAQNVSSAMSFRNSYVESSRNTLVLKYDKNNVSTELADLLLKQSNISPDYNTLPFQVRDNNDSLQNISPNIAFTHAVRKEFSADPKNDLPVFKDTSFNDTGEISFDTDKHILIVKSKKNVALAGKFEDLKKVETECLTIAIDSCNDHVAVELISLDGRQLNQSRKILCTFGTQVENTGVIWKNENKEAVNWGHAPVLMKPMVGTINLSELSLNKYEVYSLDATGKKKELLYTSTDRERKLIINCANKLFSPWILIEQKGE
jgi:hypothetical protein